MLVSWVQVLFTANAQLGPCRVGPRRWTHCRVTRAHEGRHPLCPEARREVRVTQHRARAVVATQASRSETPFDGTDELIRIPLCSQYSLILPTTSSLALSYMTRLTILHVPFPIFATHSAGALDLALKGTQPALENSSINTNPYLRRPTDSTGIRPSRAP